MSAPTILGVELTFDDDAGGLYYAATRVGSVCVFWREVKSPLVVWRWDLSQGGETLLHGHGEHHTWEAAARDADAQLSNLLAAERKRIVALIRERAARRKANGDVMGQINVGPMREEQGEWFASARALSSIADELERGE